MKSKIPKELKSLLIKRKNASEKLLSLDAEIEQKIEELGLINTKEYLDLQNDYGCMMVTEPLNYYDITIDFLEKQLNNINTSDCLERVELEYLSLSEYQYSIPVELGKFKFNNWEEFIKNDIRYKVTFLTFPSWSGDFKYIKINGEVYSHIKIKTQLT